MKNDAHKPRATPAGFAQWKRIDLPTGYEYMNFASTRARRLWNYVLAIGEAKCPRGFRHHHPATQPRAWVDEGFLVHFILAGELWHRVGGQTFVAKQNEAALVDIAHRVEYGNDRPQPTHFYWVSFNGRQMAEQVDELDAVADPIFRGLDRARVTSLFRRLIRIVSRESRGYEAQASALLSCLLADLFTVRAPQCPVVDLPTDMHKMSEPVRRAIWFLSRRYGDRWSMKELCRNVGLSLSHFYRLFRRETGYSPVHYLNRYRIEQAKILLAETHDSIDRVARDAGIANPKYFARLFRKLTGQSPSAYRAQAGARGHKF